MKTFLQFITESDHSTLQAAKDIITKLRAAGHQAYLVGGCVRDTLLGLHPKDFDVATDAVPDQVLQLFPHADKVGAHFGVVIEDGTEIATFRSDSVDSDGRRPDHVTYEKTPKADASRRDFTCNAMFMDPFNGHILDFFGGKEDIKNRVLRAVGDPHKRFQEDHLRMMRAMRFAARLGFTIEPETLSAMSGQAAHIKDIAIERVTAELTKALSTRNGAGKAVDTLKGTGILQHILPEVDSLSALQWGHTLAALNQLKSASVPMALATLLSQVSKPETLVPRIAKRMKWTTEETVHVTTVLKLQPEITASPKDTIDKLKKLMRNAYFVDAISLYGIRVHVGDTQAHGSAFRFLSDLFETMTHEDLNPQRLVTGDDLIAMGLKPGKEFREILDAIEVGQLTGRIRTKEQAMELVKDHRILKV